MGIYTEIANLVPIILKFRFKVFFVFCFSLLKYWLSNSRKRYLNVTKITCYRINRPEIALKGRSLENVLKLNGNTSLFEFIFRNAILSLPILTYSWQLANLIMMVFSPVQLTSLSFFWIALLLVWLYLLLLVRLLNILNSIFLRSGKSIQSNK